MDSIKAIDICLFYMNDIKKELKKAAAKDKALNKHLAEFNLALLRMRALRGQLTRTAGE